MQTTKIKKVKILKDKPFHVEYTKTDLDNTSILCNEQHSAEVHPDLKRAFAGLDIHLGFLSEFIPSAGIEDLDKVDPLLDDDFHVTSYSVGGDDEDPGIVITGTKILKTGKHLTINTPLIRFEQPEDGGYKFIDDLVDKVGVIQSEVLKYLNEGKRAEDPQPELPFGEEPITNLQIASPETDEDRGEAILKNLKNGNGLADSDIGDITRAATSNEDAISGAVGELVSEHLNGNSLKAKRGGRK